MISILDNGIRTTDNGRFLYAWYHIQENYKQFFRVVALKELTTLTSVQNNIDDEGMLGKQWGAMRGLHNAGVNFVYTTCGIFNPSHYGIVQLYGAGDNGLTEDEAAAKALNRMEAVIGTLAAYPQSQTEHPDTEVMRWYTSFLTRTNNLLVVLGQPDPRFKRRISGAIQGSMSDESNNDLAREQNEILLRGLSALGQNFVFQINASHVERGHLIEDLMSTANLASDYASKQRGAVSASMSFSIPIVTSAAQSFSGNLGSGEGQSHGVNDGISHNWGQTHGDSLTHSQTHSTSSGVTETFGESGTSSRVSSIGSSTAHTDGHATTDGSTTTTTTTSSVGGSTSSGDSSSFSFGSNEGGSVSGNAGVDIGVNVGGSIGSSWGSSDGMSFSSSESSSSSWGTSTSESVSNMHSETVSTADTVGQSQGQATGLTTGWMHSMAYSYSEGNSTGEAQGVSDGISDGWGQAHSLSDSISRTLSRSGGQSIGQGLSGGVVPGIGLSRSYQTENDQAIRVTEWLRLVESQLSEGSRDGAFMANTLLMTENEAGMLQAASLIPPAFHGSGVPRPVMTIHPDVVDQPELMAHARTFLPCEMREENDDPFNGILWTKYSSLLTARQMAAYTTPAVLQEGSLKIIEPIPDGVGFYPNMPGEVVLGHLISPTTGKQTNAQCRLDKKRLMHTMFAGNTGFGKSVLAERMVREVSHHWNMRCIVLDFGYSWRKLLNAPGLEGKVDIRQLRPDGVRPLRWNPLKVGRYINPETQLKAFVDIFSTIGQVGQKQQTHRLLDAVRKIFIRNGVLVDDPDVRKDPVWGKVANATEAGLCGRDAGTYLPALSQDQRQIIAHHRSRYLSLTQLYKYIEDVRDKLPERDQVGRGVLDGLTWRLNGLTKGAAESMFAADSTGSESISIEELGRPNNLVVLEGGKFLDNFTKAFLLSWAGWMIYADMVARRERQLNRGEADLFMVFEEANIIFSGVDGGDPEQKGGPSVSEQYSNMFRDARKYGTFFGVITQSPALIPPGIRSSCNNIFSGYLSESKDKDIVLPSLGRSEKGFVDEPWRRFISNENIGMLIGRMPYVFDRTGQLPFLIKPLMLEAEEPSDNEIAQKLGEIRL